MPCVTLTGGNGLGASGAVVDGKVEGDGAVATLGVES